MQGKYSIICQFISRKTQNVDGKVTSIFIQILIFYYDYHIIKKNGLLVRAPFGHSIFRISYSVFRISY